MHIKGLYEFLTSKCGSPKRMEHDNALCWDWKRGRHATARICVSTQERERIASMWIFDPSADETIAYLHVKDQGDFERVRAALTARFSN